MQIRLHTFSSRRISQSQEPVQLELKVNWALTGWPVVPPHDCAQVRNERTVLFKRGQLLFVHLANVVCTLVVERY